jgi:hypothetical protein
LHYDLLSTLLLERRLSAVIATRALFFSRKEGSHVIAKRGQPRLSEERTTVLALTAAALTSEPTTPRLLAERGDFYCDWELGKRIISGITGSIPVAPTIFSTHAESGGAR